MEGGGKEVIALAAFEVLGLPAPQGSHTAVSRGDRAIVIEGGSDAGRAKHRAWREAVAWTARDIAEPEPHDGPLSLDIEFRLPMPKSRPKRARESGMVPHAVRPDLDKLVRSTLDGLTDGGLIADDARVFHLNVSAWEVTGWTGADIVLRRAEL